MAFTRQGNYIATGNKTTGTSIAATPSSAIAVGELAIAAVVLDNQSTTAGDTTLVSVADDQSNSWTRLFEYTETGGSAVDGVTIAAFYTVVTTQIGTGDNITATFNNVPAKGFTVDVWQCNGIDSVETAVTAGGSGTSPSAAKSGLSSAERLWIGAVGWENKSSSFTEDTGFNTASQSSFHCGDSGGPTSCVSGALAYLVATQTGDTYAPTTTSADWAVGIVAFNETAGSTPVNKDIQLLWDMRNLVNKDTQLLWDIKNFVNKDSQLVWDILTLVNKDTQLVWDIANLVNKDIQLVWDMEGSVWKEIQLYYDILNLVNKDTQLLWDIFTLVNKDVQIVWDIGELVNKDIQLMWDMDGVVSKDMQLLWDINTIVNKDIQLIYDITNLVNKDIQIVWDMTELVNKDAQLVWDILTLANKDVQLVWDILEGSGTVNKDIQLIWDMGGSNRLLISTDGKTFFIT